MCYDVGKVLNPPKVAFMWMPLTHGSPTGALVYFRSVDPDNIFNLQHYRGLAMPSGTSSI